MKSKGFGILFVCLALIFAPAMLAQNVQNNGTIQGTVVDAGGAAVVGASVTVVSDDVGTTRAATSNAEGFYAFTELSPGRYHVVVKKDGFKTENQSGIELHIGSTVVVGVKLTVGAVVETLTVEASAIQVNTTDGTLGVITEGQTVRELPLNGLNFIGLTLLVPGASTQDGFNTSAKGLEGGTDISFSGGQRTGNLFTVDGSPINDTGSQRTIFIYPALDSIDEFKIATNSYGPEYGQSGGAQVNIVTKRGTNDLHGSLFYYGRNDALNANGYFNKNTSPELQRPPLRRNDFGFSAGGPIKKNKLFFFTSEEWNRQIEGSLHAGKTPTAAELAGDFTGAPVPGFAGNHRSDCYFNPNLPSAGIIDFPVVDPANGQPLTNINSTVEGPSPAGTAIIRQYPAANVAPTATNPCPGTNYKQVLNTPLYYYQTNARVDYVLDKSTTIFAKYTRDWWDQHTPSLAGAEWGESGLPAVDSQWTQPSNLATIRVSRVLGSSSINDFQFSYSGNHINITPGGTQPGLTQQIYASLNPTYGLAGKTAGKNLTSPLFWGPGGYSTLWNIAPFDNREDRYTWTDDYSKVVGTHQVRLGVLIAHNLKDQANNGDFNEAPIFWGPSGTCPPTNLNCGTSGFQFPFNNTGNGIASILLKGTLFGGSESSALKNAATRYQDFEWYVSDTWKATRRLAFNYGFRWSVLAQPYLSDNTYGLFVPSLFNVNLTGSKSCDGILLAPSKTNPCAAIGAGGSSVSNYRGIVANQYHNVAPRLGVAYDLFGDGKTSLRAGVGQFYIRYQLDPIYIAGAQNSPFVANTSGTRNLDGNFTPASGFGTPSFARSPTTDIPNTWQWNATIEREIMKNSTLEISYVGTRGIHLQSYQDLAQVTPNCTGPGVNTAGLNIPAGDTCRQFYYIDSSNNPNGRQRFLPYQSFFGQNASLNSGNFDGSSAYHSLQTLFRGKFGHGSTYQATYTWSKLLGYQGINGLNGAGFSDNSNPRLDYGPAGFDRRHIFTGSAVYLLPVLKNQNSIVRNTIGGWELAPIVTFETGTPITPGIGGPDLSGTSTNLDRPNRVAGQPCSIHVPGLKEQLLNPNAFTLNGFVLGTNGTAGLADCYGPGVNNWDLGLHKDFKITERIGAQFRFEFFNFFNKTEFQGVNGGLGPSQLCYQDINGAPINATYNNASITNTGDTCFLSGRPFGESNLPNNAYKVVAGPGGVSQTLLSSTFGQATFTRPARQIQYALRFTF
jgi:hypothetical protein